jgi:hypothetical protein
LPEIPVTVVLAMLYFGGVTPAIVKGYPISKLAVLARAQVARPPTQAQPEIADDWPGVVPECTTGQGTEQKDETSASREVTIPDLYVESTNPLGHDHPPEFLVLDFSSWVSQHFE